MFTKRNYSRTTVKRGLFVVALSVGLLCLALVIAARLTQQRQPVSPSAPTSTAQAGPYTVALSITPNPPSTYQATHLTLRVTDTATGQPVIDASVQVQGKMESMEMLTRALYANSQGDGLYTIDASLSMSGLWRFQVIITRLNTPPASTQFEITAQ